MKKTLLSLMVTLVAFHLHAQFNWGVRTGVQVSNLHFNHDTDSYQRKFSYVVPGFYFQQQLNDRGAISAEIQFANKGFWNRLEISPGQTEHVRFALPYITLPVLYHYSVSPAVTVFGGVEPAVKLITSAIAHGERETDNNLFTRRFDLGITGGVSLPLTENYSLMLRYTQGLVNVLDKDATFWDVANQRTSTGYDLGYRFTNRSFQLSLTSALNIAKGEGKTRFSYGLRQGVSFSHVYGSGIESRTGNTEPSKKRIAYEAGVEIRFDIQKYFFASTGLSFIQKGGQVEGDEPVKISALMLPLMIGISPVKTDDATFSIEGGIGISRHLSMQNPYEDASSYSHVSDFMGTFIYGFELAVPANDKISIFLSYRNSWDSGDFYEADDYLGSLNYSARAYSINIGARIKTNPRNKQRDEDDHNDSDIGVKGGFNINNTTYQHQPADSPNSRGLKAGLHLGMYFKIRLGKKTALIPELHYLATYYSAIENPLVFSFTANNKISLEAGMQWSVIVSNHEGKVGSYDEETSKRLDLGVIGGLKYELTNKLVLGLRYFRSTKDTFAWYDNGSRLDTRGFNRNVQASLYYSFMRR